MRAHKMRLKEESCKNAWKKLSYSAQFCFSLHAFVRREICNDTYSLTSQNFIHEICNTRKTLVEPSGLDCYENKLISSFKKRFELARTDLKTSTIELKTYTIDLIVQESIWAFINWFALSKTDSNPQTTTIHSIWFHFLTPTFSNNDNECNLKFNLTFLAANIKSRIVLKVRREKYIKTQAL